MKVLCSIAMCLLIASVAFGEQCTRNDVRCIDYTVVEKHQEYEVRSYPSLVWVSVSQNGSNKSEVSRSLIRQLYAYIGGGNSEKKVFNMMVPVRTAKIPHNDYNTYIMSFALYPENSENPPQPTNPNISVIREPAVTYYARSFEGFAKEEETWDKHASALIASMVNGERPETSFYFICVYDSPWRETNRLNEVWMFKKEEE